jgi:CHAD domain-containing protein
MPDGLVGVRFALVMPIATERVQFVFQKLERDLVKLSSHQPMETVHAFRTSARRLQTLLEQVLTGRDRNQKKLLKLLGEIRKYAGKVRDLDVQLTALRSLKTPQEPRRKTQLIQKLLELRAQHEKKLRKHLTKQTIREIRKRLKRTAKEDDWHSSRDPLAIAAEILKQAAPAPDALTGSHTDDALHRFRIAVKSARYAAEFAPKSAQARQFIAQLQRLQDALGTWHDWMTLTNTAAARLGDVNQSPLVAEIYNVTGGRLRQAVAALSTLPLQNSPKLSANSSSRSRSAKMAAPARTDSAA